MFLSKLMGKPDAARAAGPETLAPVVVVAATRLNEEEFWRTSNLGASLGKARLKDYVSWSIAYNNRDGLPLVYNRALRTLPDEALVAFIHDDVFIYDYFLANRLNDAVDRFDVIGVAGDPAPRAEHIGWGAWRTPGQSSGIAADHTVKSGAVEHSKAGNTLEITYFGPSPRGVKLLDGLFLAARAGTLRRDAVEFDEQFDFHFYDLDFCRTCAAAGLSLGTWPIAVSHASEGAFGSPAWEAALAKYQLKWAGKKL